jgi:hypothetical protein
MSHTALKPIAARLRSATGLPGQALADQLGVPVHTVRCDTTRSRTGHVSAVVQAAIDTLGLPGVDAMGARRRLQALAAFGWSMTDAGDMTARPWRNLVRVRNAERLIIEPDLDADIRGLYRKTWNQFGGSQKAELHAHKMHWPVPLWWDEEDTPGHWIDNPCAFPAPGYSYDLPLPSKRMAGPKCVRAERQVEEAREILRTEGGTTEQIAARLGITANGLLKACERAGISVHDLAGAGAAGAAGVAA